MSSDHDGPATGDAGDRPSWLASMIAPSYFGRSRAKEFVPWDEERSDGHKKWVSTANFPDYFPRLLPIVNPIQNQSFTGDIGTEGEMLDPRVFLENEHLHHARIISETLVSPYFAALVLPGHGATTLCRYIFEASFSGAVTRRQIPVRISLEDHLDLSGIRERFASQLPHGHLPFDEERRLDYQLMLAEAERIQALPKRARRREAERVAEQAFAPIIANAFKIVDDAIRVGVVTNLVLGHWERSLSESYYAALIGARGQSDDDIERQRALLASWLHPQPNWTVLEAEAPRLCQPPHLLLADLAQRMGVRVSLQIDLSSSPIGRYTAGDSSGNGIQLGPEKQTSAFHDAASAILQVLKNLDGSNVGVLPSLLNQALFVSPAALDQMITLWQIDPKRTSFPLYSPADVYAMIAYHFRPIEALGTRRRDAIAAVVPSKLLRHIASRDQAISTTIIALQKKLSEANPNPDLVSYQIDPDTGTESHDPSS